MLALSLVLGAAGVSQADPQTASPVPDQAANEPTEIIQVYRGVGYFDIALAEKLRAVLSQKSEPANAASPTASPGAPATGAASPAQKKIAEAAPTPLATQAAGGGNGLVWVNGETHVYHKEGSKWYGRTKRGKYESEQDAIKEGNRASKNEKQ
jgi:hypothetical protein